MKNSGKKDIWPQRTKDEQEESKEIVEIDRPNSFLVLLIVLMFFIFFGAGSILFL